MSIEAVVEHMTIRAEKSSSIGGTIKFVLDEYVIHIDGSGDENEVSTEDKEADCVITTTIVTLTQIRSGELNPMMAVMSGKIKIKGDMGLAMKLQSIL